MIIMIDLHHDVNIVQKLQMMLSPQLLQMLNLLSLPLCDLIERIEKEAEENPVLEIKTTGTLFEYIKYLGADKKLRKEVDFSEYDGLKNVAAPSRSLRDHLLEQLKLTELSGPDHETAVEIINHIDQNGYLKNFSRKITKTVERVLKVIQTFEPDGVGARDLAECLLIQVREYNFDDPEIEDLIRIVVEKHLEDLGKQEYKKIAAAEGVDEEDIVEVARFIKDNLTPYPAAGFSQKECSVVPSFAVEVESDKMKVTNLEERYGPKIAVSEQYLKMLKNPATDEKTVKFLKERYEKAVNLIEHLAKRLDTGNRIIELVADRQAEFFKKGADKFRPLLQKEIAMILGLHPSTISRAVAGKYVQTSKGLLPLKYLCPRDLSGFSTYEIKQKIKDIVAAENKAHPLSDSQILEHLVVDGIRLSRRTVSTFRKELGIRSFKERNT